MKARLGVDLQDGWLLLGSAGVTQASGLSIAAATGGSSALSAHAPATSAASVLLRTGTSPGSGSSGSVGNNTHQTPR